MKLQGSWMTRRFIAKQSRASLDEKVKSYHDHRHPSDSCTRGIYGTQCFRKTSAVLTCECARSSRKSRSFLSQQALASCLLSIGLVHKTWHYCSVAETVSLFIILTQKSLMKATLLTSLSKPLPKQGRSYKKGDLKTLGKEFQPFWIPPHPDSVSGFPLGIYMI